MKKLKIAFRILVVVALVVSIIYVKFSTKIHFDSDNIYQIKGDGFGYRSLEKLDKSEVKKVLNYLEALPYCKNSERKVHNESPDAGLIMRDKDGKVVDRINFYGSLVEYRGDQYTVFPSMDYDSLENFCNELEKK